MTEPGSGGTFLLETHHVGGIVDSSHLPGIDSRAGRDVRGKAVTAYEEVLEIPQPVDRPLLEHLSQSLRSRIAPDLVPVRVAVARSDRTSLQCEVGVVAGLTETDRSRIGSIFEFRRLRRRPDGAFTTVFLVPTGIGCTVGGHAGDATPAARLLAAVSDRLITHPNVVNASDLNELPDNGLYVEGSVLARFLLGTIGLEATRANRVLAVVDSHPDPFFTAAAVNSVSAARSTFGLVCPEVVVLEQPTWLGCEYAPSGRATGRVEGLERLLAALDERRGTFDAIALSTQIMVPFSYHLDYYLRRGEMINPWGGVEALLTHAVSFLCNVPAAHSPMLESHEVAELEVGTVDPRMAAEVISIGFFVSVLKGLHRAPRIVSLDTAPAPGVLTASDVSCLVMPDKVLGLPTLAALEQGIPVVAVRENENVLENDLSALPWAPGQLLVVDNYWEAAGVVASLREGIAPEAVRRPLVDTAVLKRVSGAASDAPAVAGRSDAREPVPASADAL